MLRSGINNGLELTKSAMERAAWARDRHWLWTVRISRADVADFMLNQLSDDRYLRSAPGCAGS